MLQRMFLFNTKMCEIAKIYLADSQFKFKKSLAVFCNFFQLVEFYYFSSEIFYQLFNVREDSKEESQSGQSLF